MMRELKLSKLKGIIPGYNTELTKEGTIINNNTAAINEYLTALERQIKLKAAQEELEAAYKKKRELEKLKLLKAISIGILDKIIHYRDIIEMERLPNFLAWLA